MQFQLRNGQCLHFSDSLWRLIDNNARMSPCLMILQRGLYRSAAFYIPRAYQRRMRKWDLAPAWTNPMGRPDSRPNNKTGLSWLLNQRLPGNYFAFREQEGMISYTPHGKTIKINPDGSWKREGRVSMKPGRFIRAMLNPTIAKRIKDTEYATFQDLVRAEEMKGKIDFELIDPQDGYLLHKTPIKSCMSNMPVGEFYSAFGAKVLIGKRTNDGNSVVARAVVWPNVEVPSLGRRTTLLDRIYSRDSETTRAMIEYANEEKWWHKGQQNREPTEAWVDEAGKVHRTEVRCHTLSGKGVRDGIFCPFLDTLCWMPASKNYVSNTQPRSTKDHLLQHTDGGPFFKPGTGEIEIRRTVTDIDGQQIPEDEAISVRGYYYHEDDDRIVCIGDDDSDEGWELRKYAKPATNSYGDRIWVRKTSAPRPGFCAI